ncbi:hypothetical protein [Segetibacter aerophilus]|uniref:Lipocalin-like domain-containing protein n=1 Tax=Segetibacter aerophilus TaxID=670293 RepID=A0A512BE35_9BACT|nr:hypothetical protein [Segetibacter aerophilus]GEO10222.1 hypothetical protein SAE01_27180 [Segetibacter aerophilus]
MKSGVLIIAFALLTIFTTSCSKDNNESTTPIEGNWELVRVQGGRASVTNYPRGNGNRLRFTGANYQASKNGQIVKSGSFTILNDPSADKEICLVLQPNEYRQRILYDNDYTASKVFFQVKNDTLTFLSGCFAVDAGTSKEYMRQ